MLQSSKVQPIKIRKITVPAFMERAPPIYAPARGRFPGFFHKIFSYLCVFLPSLTHSFENWEFKGRKFFVFCVHGIHRQAHRHTYTNLLLVLPLQCIRTCLEKLDVKHPWTRWQAMWIWGWSVYVENFCASLVSRHWPGMVMDKGINYIYILYKKALARI